MLLERSWPADEFERKANNNFFVAVLRRVKDFLPKMKEAEETLQKELHFKSASELDIENVEDTAPYIEMVKYNLCFGLCKRIV